MSRSEYQAAGRIHRLGQTKPVGVTKYVFEDSCESRIVALHERIAQGDLRYTTGMLSPAALEVLRQPDPPAATEEWKQQRHAAHMAAVEAENDSVRDTIQRELGSTFRPPAERKPWAAGHSSSIAQSQGTGGTVQSPYQSHPTMVAAGSSLLAQTKPTVAVSCSETSSNRTVVVCGFGGTCSNPGAKACANKQACGKCCKAYGPLDCPRHKRKVKPS